jgi:hypothetical protein
MTWTLVRDFSLLCIIIFTKSYQQEIKHGRFTMIETSMSIAMHDSPDAFFGRLLDLISHFWPLLLQN